MPGVNWKALSICAALAVVAAACGTPGPPGPIPESTHRYVVSVVDIPDITPDGHAVGFNVDAETDDPMTPGREDVDDGTGPECTDDADFVSAITGEVGVDNQLAAYVIGLFGGSFGPGGVHGKMLEQVADGAFLLLMDVTSNGLVDDETVSVHLFLAAPPGPACDNRRLVCPAGARCPSTATVAMPGLCGPKTGGPVAPETTGRIVAGQAFLEMTDLGTADARIADGRLEFEAPMIPVALPLPLDSGATFILPPLHEAHVAGDLSPDGASVTNGEIGARVRSSDLTILADGHCVGFDWCWDSVRSIAHPDLDVDATMVCQAVSAGLTFEAVRAE